MRPGKVALKIIHMSLSIVMLLLIVFLLYRGGLLAYDFGYRVYTETAVDMEEDGKDKLVQITSDMSASEIGDLLETKGLVRNRTLFAIQLKMSAYKDKIKAGSYTLNTSMTPREIMQVMSGEEIDDTEAEIS